LREVGVLLKGLGIDLLTLDDFPAIGPITEDGDTLEGNALKKAREVFRQTGLPSVADDTGLEVRYLNDAPGVYSSRYAGPGATYADNCRKLIDRMKGVPPRRRAARFRSVVAFVAPDGFERTAEGMCTGVITESPRGTGGFGYDPLFLPDGTAQTFGEMPEDLKNRVSHRAKALEALNPILREYFKNR
jgi:XTP/dITP diphosphohydrolase